MDNNTAALERFLCRNVLVKRQSAQTWSPAVGVVGLSGVPRGIFSRDSSLTPEMEDLYAQSLH